MAYNCKRMFCTWPKTRIFELSMGGLNWNGNREPKYWTKNNRLCGVKVKLSYISEGLERLLLLQLIKEKLTNLDKFPPLKYHKILDSPPSFLFPLPEFQKKFPPINMSCLKSWFPHLYKGGEETKSRYSILYKLYHLMAFSLQLTNEIQFTPSYLPVLQRSPQSMCLPLCNPHTRYQGQTHMYCWVGMWWFGHLAELLRSLETL